MLDIDFLGSTLSVFDLLALLSNPESEKAQKTSKKKIFNALFTMDEKAISEWKQNISGMLHGCKLYIDRSEDEEDIEFVFTLTRQKQPKGAPTNDSTQQQQ